MKRSDLLWIILLLVLVACSFLPSLNNGFTNWDDPVSLTNNTQITKLSWKNTAHFFQDLKHPHEDFYKPLVLLSYAVEYRFFGLDPHVYHTTNLVLHLLNCFLVFTLIRFLGGPAIVCFITAALFGIHPMHVESVAWVSERKDVLYAFFFLASLLAYLAYLRNGRLRAYGLCFLFFILSLLSKPMAVTLPVVMLLLDLLVERPYDRWLFTEKIPFFILALAFGILTILTASLSPGSYSPLKFPDSFFLMNDALVFYAVKFFVPVRLSCGYPFPANPGYFLYGLLFSPLLVLLGAVLLFILGRRSRKILFGGLFFLVTILPTLQMAPSGSLAADRYTYIAFVGLFYLAAIGFKKLLDLAGSEQRRVLVFWFIIAGILGAFSFLTWQRCGVWKDSEKLWSDLLKQDGLGDPSRTVNGVNLFALAYNARGSYYLLRNENAKALSDFEHSIALAPNHIEARNNCGVIHGRMGEHTKAVEDYTEALKIEPDLAALLNNRAAEYGRLGLHEKAIVDYDHAIRSSPSDANLYINRSKEYNRVKEYSRAMADFNRAASLNPSEIDPGMTTPAHDPNNGFSHAESADKSLS